MFAAKAAGLPMDKVRLHTLVSGGSFGRRANAWSDFTVAAVNVAKAIDGRAPVRLQFTPRGRHRRRPVPADVRARGQGRPRRARAASPRWQHTIVGQSIIAGTPMAAMIKDGIDPTSVEGVDRVALRRCR